MTDSTPQTAFDHSELGGFDAVETAARVRSGDLKASEVIAAAIERARVLQPTLNAIFTTTYDNATRVAEQPVAGPLAGVPSFIKGLDGEAGVVNDFGTTALRDNVARRTDRYVGKFLETGP